MTEQAKPGTNELDLARMAWRKSTYSGHNSDCLEVAPAAWRKSTHSGHNEECVEVAPTPDLIAVRDSKSPSGPVLAFAAAEWTAFVAGVRAGEFDL